jgi:hypothetical protein
MSRFWKRAFRVQYRILALMDPLVRRLWGRFGIGITVDVTVPRRDGKGDRSRLLGLLRVGDKRYLGHPNGDVGWTRDLQAAGGGSYRWPGAASSWFRATRLADGPERNAVIRATMQQPFPGNLMYWLGRKHIQAVGVYFRLDPPS